MQLELNQVLSGFKLIKQEFVTEVASNVLIFEHEVTKATLVALKNSDNNKNFCITFKTTPKDSTGVAHVLEHIVLAGSEKYPLKDVFFEMAKGSLTTYMNALTGPDMTYYPFATRNLKEYFNFMDIYLDTTLNPLLKREIFRQEGWHYEQLSPEDKISFKGVVFNEMKGAMSDPIDQLVHHIYQTMYPKTTYEHNSGGDPKNIIDLTYEQLKAFHEEYYHPSNSLIYLYGDAPLEEELAFINNNFLKNYSYRKVDSELKRGDNIQQFTTKFAEYSIGEDEDKANKTYLGLGIDIDTAHNQELLLAMNLITDLIFNSESSPLKRAVMATGMAHDVTAFYNNHMFFTNVIFMLIGSETDKKELFLQVYRDTMAEIIKDGIDKEYIASELNNLEFKIKESSVDVRRGFSNMMSVTHAFSYGVDLCESLKINDLFTNLREKALNSRYLEEIIETHLLNNEKMALIIMEPDAEKAQKDQDLEDSRLEAYNQTLTAADREELISESNKLLEMQKEPEKLENIEKLPKLALSDLEREVKLVEPDIQKIGNTTLLINRNFTNGIVYLSIGFHLDKVPAELLSCIELFADILTEIGTKNRSYTQLDCDLKANLGGFYTNLQVHSHLNKGDHYTPIMWIETKAFSSNLDKMVELITDVCVNLDLENHARIEEVMFRNYTHKERQIQSEGFIYPLTRVKSYLSQFGRYADAMRGMEAYQNFKHIVKNYEAEKVSFVKKLKSLQELIFNQNNLLINIIADEDKMNGVIEQSKELISKFSDKSLPVAVINFPEPTKNEAFKTSSQVVFAAQGANIFKCGLNYSGAFEVLKNYISGEYLFNKVRVQGGAYGCMVRFNECEGELIFISYRDPNVKETYQAYSEVHQAISELSLTEEQLTNLKIGSYSDFDPLQNVFTRGIVARNNYLAGITPTHINRIVSQILDCKLTDLKAMAPAFEGFAKNGVRSVIGNSIKIEESKDLFNEIIQV